MGKTKGSAQRTKEASAAKQDCPPPVDTAGSLALFLAHEFQRYLDRSVVDLGIKGRHAQTLLYLGLGNGADSQNALACKLSVDKGTVSRTVASLVELDLVEQNMGLQSNRGTRVQLTKRGEKVAKKVTELAEAWADEVTKGIPKPARTTLMQNLRLMSDQAEDFGNSTRATVPAPPHRQIRKAKGAAS